MYTLSVSNVSQAGNTLAIALTPSTKILLSLHYKNSVIYRYNCHTHVISSDVSTVLNFSASARAIAPSVPKPLYDKLSVFNVWFDLRP